jgi:hypothetical protein
MLPRRALLRALAGCLLASVAAPEVRAQPSRITVTREQPIVTRRDFDPRRPHRRAAEAPRA